MNAKKKALGRGLSALLENSGTEEIKHQYRQPTESILSGSIANIPVDRIDVNPYQPRTSFDKDSLRELATSIKEHGIIQPITVREAENGRFQLISGERRLKASKTIGIEFIPSYIRTATKEGMLEMALVENIQRKDLNPIEVSLSFQRLIEECKLTHEELSDKVGKDRTTITNYLRLLKLPASIQMGLQDGNITIGHARAIVSVPSIDTQLAVYKDILEQDLSVRETEEIVRNIDAEPYKANISKKEISSLSPKFQKIKEQFTKHFEIRVDLRRNNKGKGSITLHFKTDNELDQIISKLRK